MLIAQNLLKPFHLMVRVSGRITTVMYTQPEHDIEKKKGYLTLSPKAVVLFPLLIKACILFAALILAQIFYEVKLKSEVNPLT